MTRGTGRAPHVRPRVVLVGPMGAGKTTVGRLLGERWGVAVRDTDADVETTTGRTVSDIFVEDGEQHFRDLERNAVATALVEHDGVLALGGGLRVFDAATGARRAVYPRREPPFNGREFMITAVANDGEFLYIATTYGFAKVRAP